MNDISNLLVKIDRFCDHIPLVSSITNLVDLFQKLAVLPFVNKTTIASNHYYKHINEKSFARCFLLVIPVIGNISIEIYDFYQKKRDNNNKEHQVKHSIEICRVNKSDILEDSEKEAFELKSSLVKETELKMGIHLRSNQKATLMTLFDQALKMPKPQQAFGDLINGKINQSDGWSEEKAKHIRKNLLHHFPVEVRFLNAHNLNFLKIRVQMIAQTPISSQGEKLVCFYKTGPTEFLGNFATCPQGIQIWGHSFKCSEAAFQWRKYYLAASDNNRQDILKDPKMQEFFTCNGEEAFRLNREFGRQYHGIFPLKWLNGIRDQVMWNVLNAKFQQNPSFAKLLKATQGAYLLEHNQATRDDYWSDNSNGSGKNMLGKMLMALRDDRACPPTNDSSDQVSIQTYANYANQPMKLGYQIF